MITKKHFYVRNKNGVPVGCVFYNVFKTGEVTFGTASHNPIDKFDRQRMIDIAMARSVGSGCEVIIMKPNDRGGQIVRAIKMRIITRAFPHRIRRPLRDQRATWDRD